MASQEATDAWGGDDSNSLFEGMVLFAPSLSPDPDLPAGEAKPPSQHHDDVSAAAAAESQPPQPQQPLDKDLFSDLTLLPLQTPPLDQTPAAPAPPSSILSRQPSSSSSLRKKKRAVRIGYGRSPPPAASSPTVTTAASATTFLADASPHPTAPPTPTPDHQQKQGGNGQDAVAVDPGVNSLQGKDVAVDPGVNSLHGKEEEEEEDVKSEVEVGVGKVGIEETLVILRSQISHKLETIQQRAAAVAARRKELAVRRRKVAEDAGSASSRHRDLERELEEACKAEDFESAERISDSLAALEKEKDSLLAVLRDAEVDYDSVELEMQEVLDSRIAAEEEAAALLEQFATDANNYADSVNKQAEEMSSKEIEGWQTSMELLETEKLELDVEAQLVLAARSGLEGSIEHLIEDDKTERDMLRKKGDTLAEELAGLLELVRLKEAEIAANNNRIQEVEERISNVVSKFHGSQSDIDLKLNNLQAAQSKIDVEAEALFIKKNEIDKFISLGKENDSKLREIVSTSSSEAKACQQSVEIRRKLASSVSKSRQDRVALLMIEEEILKEIQMLRQQITDARTSLQEISSRRAGIQQQMASLKQRLSYIDKRGPELEAEKKVAAAARNFKEAGRIAAEAKALNVEKDELHAKWEKASADLETIEKDIAATTEKIQECEGLVLLKEKESAMTSYKRLQLVSAAARAERAAAIEMGDSEEGELLLKEYEAAESKAMELKKCYDLQPEKDDNMLQPVVPITFLTSLTAQQLAEIAASFSLSPQNDESG